MCNKLTYRISLVLLFGLFTGVADADITSAMVAYYPLDGDATDATGNGHDGTIMGDPQFVPGKFGQALEFEDRDYVQVTGYIPISGGADRTVTAWVKMEDLGVQGIVAWGIIQAQSKWVIRLSTKGQIRLEIEGDAIKGNTRLVDGEWHHIAVSFANDGTPELGEVELYADGVLQSHAQSTTKIDTSETGNLEIGRNLKNDGFFQGAIDEVKIYDRALSVEEILQDMEGPPSYAFATGPNPPDGATDVQRSVVLSWTPLIHAGKHDVYLGTNSNDVSGADRANPLNVLKSQNQDPNTYDPPGLLDFGQTYYWRVDEVNGPPDFTIHPGDVWSFTAEPFAYAIGNVTATASSQAENQGPENTVDGSGLADELHSNETADMWLSSSDDPGPARIEYEFDKVYKLHQMWVWNFNDSLEPMIGFGLKEATIEYSVNGIDYTRLGTTHEFAQGSGAPDYAHNTIADFDGVAAKFVRITANSNWGIGTTYGLSEVRFLYIPIRAREPNPDSGATDVDLDVTLGWRLGRQVAEHNVYFSTSWKAVVNGTAPMTTVTEARYGPLSLDLGETYYWRVDEVNDLETPKTLEGDVWSFSTHGFLAVDDFEGYDANDNQIWYAWNDGPGYGTPGTLPYYAGNGTGAAVGDETTSSYTEESIVHGGRHSMPYSYNNNKQDKAKYSEAKMTLSSQRDWTQHGVKALALWFRGYPVSVGSFTEEPVGTYTMTARGADIWGTSDEFHFAFKQLSGAGSIIARAESVQNTHNSAKAGVMIRDTLEAGSAHAMVIVSPSNRVAFQRRNLAGDTSFGTTETGITTPQWVKIERDISGNVTPSYSADGISWTELGGELIPMSTPMYIGLALTSHNTTATCEAVFSDVQITGAAGSQWTNLDIGILSNDPEPMYVALANSNRTTGIVYHDDTDATRIDTWTEWNIDLKDFADQGVSLTDVNSIAIGFGDRNNPQAGGSGKMYFDDIRLYRPRCVPDKVTLPAADLNSNCVVDMADVELMASEWLASGADMAADLNSDGTVDFEDYAVLADSWLDEQLWPEW